MCEYESTFIENDTYKHRCFSLSKSYLTKNAIIKQKNVRVATVEIIKTTLTLSGPSEKPDISFYNKATANLLKQELITRYMIFLCVNRENLPQIKITHYIDDKIDHQAFIQSQDIPPIDKSIHKNIFYYSILSDGKSFEKIDKLETFNLFAFKIDKQLLEKNAIKFTSKGEIVSGTPIDLEILLEEDNIDGSRYLFLISSTYLDSKDSDTRGFLNIRTREEAKKANSQSNYLLDEPER